MGPDGMHSQVLRGLSDIITRLLSIIEKSWQLEEDWKKANVTPVFKKGKKDDRRNYRSIRLSSVPGQVIK